MRGNVNWMNARRRTMESDLLGADLDKMWPIIPHGQSDTACLDNALELLVAGGYSLAHAMMMLIPEAWAGNPLMDAKRKAFYEYHAALMEPWDGPAAIAFTDGRQIGATLDRNGLRPARFLVTDDDLVVMASEAGVLPIPDEKIVRKWRLQPGKMLLIDLEAGPHRRGRGDQAHPRRGRALRGVADARPSSSSRSCRTCPTRRCRRRPTIRPPCSIASRPSATPRKTSSSSSSRWQGAATIRSARWAPTRRSPCSRSKPKLLYNYFKQNFAQVTNPPIDPIREELVMSLVSMIGPRPNLLGRHAGTHKRLEVAQPILTNEDLEKIRSIDELLDGAFRTATLDTTWPAAEGAAGLEKALDRVCREATDCVLADRNILILSDRAVSAGPRADPGAAGDGGGAPSPDPPGPAHADRPGGRDRRGARGAPFLRAWPAMAPRRSTPISPSRPWSSCASQNGLPQKAYEVQKNYIKAVGKGLLKVMSKMGISTYQSYCGAQIFDAVGLSLGLRREVLHRHRHHDRGRRPGRDRRGDGAPPPRRLRRQPDLPHHARCRRRLRLPPARRGPRLDAGDASPSCSTRCAATCRTSTRPSPQPINEQSRAAADHPRPDASSSRPTTPIPLEEVEPAAEIVKRFATGAMCFGSISREAHTTLAIAMNRIGGKSNTGEGGEESDRFKPLPNGDSMRSAIKQVASGRFGVTDRIPGQRRRPPDQDGAGRQARRGRPAARPQGRREHRPRAPLDARRRPDLAAAAPRHLFDRGPGAAHPRPEERQPDAPASR